MGKGSRNRKERQGKAIAAKQAVGDILKKAEVKRAMNKEINKQLASASDRYATDEISVILWVLHEYFGFGEKRLKRFMLYYGINAKELSRYYELSESDTPFICTKKLRDAGLDFRKWT